MNYSKRPLSYPDQLELLRARGLLIPDEARAFHYLSYISYYRLRAYWLPFEEPCNDGQHKLKSGTHFENAIALYVFDRQLRLLVLDAIERVEVAIRAVWAHHMAMSHGAHGYLEAGHYSNSNRYRADVENFEAEFKRSNDVFAAHYKQKYATPPLPPVWMAAEVMSVGTLSKFIKNLKHRGDRQAIAKQFGLDETMLVSFLQHVTIVRNICAHHSRLWNRRFAIIMKVPNYPARLSVAMKGANTSSLYNTLVMFDYLLSTIAPENDWKARLVDLLDKTEIADPGAMGFPDNWRSRPFWKGNVLAPVENAQILQEVVG